MNTRVTISLELAEYLIDRHMDCVLDDLGFEVPMGIEEMVESLRKSIGKAKGRQKVRAKIAEIDASKEQE